MVFCKVRIISTGSGVGITGMRSDEHLARVPAHWGHPGMAAAITMKGAETSGLGLGACLDFYGQSIRAGVKGEPGLGV